MGRFVINVREIEEGVSEHVFDLPVEWLAGEVEGCAGLAAGESKGSVELVATRRGREVLIKGRAATTFIVTCVRCLEDYEQPVSSEIEVLLVPGQEMAAAGASPDEEEDLGVERYQGDLIVLDDIIRDSLILELPMNPNCGDGCPGWDHLRSGPDGG